MDKVTVVGEGAQILGGSLAFSLIFSMLASGIFYFSHESYPLRFYYEQEKLALVNEGRRNEIYKKYLGVKLRKMMLAVLLLVGCAFSVQYTIASSKGWVSILIVSVFCIIVFLIPVFIIYLEVKKGKGEERAKAINGALVTGLLLLVSVVLLWFLFLLLATRQFWQRARK